MYAGGDGRPLVSGPLGRRGRGWEAVAYTHKPTLTPNQTSRRIGRDQAKKNGILLWLPHTGCMLTVDDAQHVGEHFGNMSPKGGAILHSTPKTSFLDKTTIPSELGTFAKPHFQ